MNKHKDMILKRMWITKAEEESLEALKIWIKGGDKIERNIEQTIADFFEELINRGDLE